MQSPIVTIFKNFNQVDQHQSIHDILKEIQNGKYVEQINRLRDHYAGHQIESYQDLKKKLLAFTPSGRFNEERKIKSLSEYSYFLILDLDKLGVHQQRLREIVLACPFTYACFASPSNDGLKILVRVNTDAEFHTIAFNQVKTFYESLLKTEIDASGKDVSRLCFYSYDPHKYENPQADIFQVDTEIDILPKNHEILTNNIKKISKNQQKSLKTAEFGTNNRLKISHLITKLEQNQVDITSNYQDWLAIGFALESEFKEDGRDFYHQISKINPHYSQKQCDEQYNHCLNHQGNGINLGTLFHIAEKYNLYGIIDNPESKNEETSDVNRDSTNKFSIAERYLKRYYNIRYNTVSNRYEYSEIGVEEYKELNESALYIQLRKNNITISQADLTALLKSDVIEEYDPFREYFHSIPVWDRKLDYIKHLCSFVKTPEHERFENHFKKWLVRAVKTALTNEYFNKQAIVLVSESQNSGKSTFCRFLCPPGLNSYLAENIATDKDSLIALTENFIINLDELSTANKMEINAFKSMFSKDRIKTRLPYEKRATILTRRASFIGSTDRWEFLSDENGSVRWLCFDVDSIDWAYSMQVDIDQVWSQAYALMKDPSFKCDITPQEIRDNDQINRKYQISTPERHLIQKYFEPSKTDEGEFLTTTDIQEYIELKTTLRLKSNIVGKELKFLGYTRISKRIDGPYPVYGYYVKKAAH